MRITKSKIFIVIVAVFLIWCIFFRKDYLNLTATDQADLNTQVANLCKDHVKRAKFTLDFDLYNFDIEDVRKELALTDPYAASNIGRSSWSWYEEDGHTVFKINLGYNASKKQLKKADKRIEELVADMQGMTDYEKIKAAHDYIIMYCDYGFDALAYKGIEQGPYWALYPGKTVCNGYAMTFLRIMQYCDIPATFEVGDNHAWNTVYLDGYWYNIDVTWDDLGDDGITYDYFLKTGKDFGSHEHRSDDAPASVEVTGKSAQENYEMFPNYKLRYILILLLKIVFPIIVVIALVWFQIKRKQHKRKVWAENQRRLRMQEDLDRELMRDMMRNARR